MKKILLILCALVCGTLAFAQTSGTYTDNLHVIVNGDDEGVKQGTVTIEYQDDDKSIIDFTLHDFSVDISVLGTLMSINLGDVTVYDITLGDEVDGVASFSCTDDHNVEYPDIDSEYASLVSDVSITMTGDVSETKLRANMSITVKVMAGLLSYPITATFGYDYEYLIVNAATGNYLGGGLDWGTHATEVGKPQFFLFIDQFDGTYNLFGNQGGTSIGWDAESTGLYVDGANPLTWELVDAGNGGYYIVSDDGYLTGNGFQEGVTVENTAGETAVWKLVTMDDVLATMDGATISNPVDVTALIPAPEPKRADWGSSWVTSGYGVSTAAGNVSLGQDGNVASCAESYHSNNGFDVRQTISSLPVGYYELTAQAFYRNDGGDVIPSMYITTGTSATDTNGSFENVHLPLHSSAEGAAGNMVDAYQEFLKKEYPVSLTFIVDEEDEEFTVGFESNTTGDDQMWSIFGELGLLYMGAELPTLTAVTGKMNTTVETAMTAAIATYEANKTSANYIAAEQAIFDAEESVAYYAVITEGLESEEIQAIIEGFDADGQSAFENGFYAAYIAGTLTDETLEEGIASACKAQTTAGSDMTYALKNSGEWVNAIEASNFQMCPSLPTAHEIWSASAWSLGTGETSKAAIYKQIEDLPAGEYTISFYAYGSEAENANTRPLAYANDAETTVAYASTLVWNESSLYTLTCSVDEDGILQFGMKTQGDGNWYVMEEYSLTLGEVESEEEDPYIYNITTLLANPSFEEVDVDDMTVDTGRCDETVGGAWTVTSLEGWNLAAPTHSTASYAVSDLMSAAATSTDNNFGVPGKPSDETYMLYLRESHESYEGAGTSASVMQSVVLPAGEYKLTVDSKCVASMEAAETVTLVAGDESQTLDIHITANGTDETKNNPFLDAWDTAVLTFSLTETTEVSLGVAIAYDTTKDLSLSVLLDNFQLFSTDEVEAIAYDNDVTWALANPSFEVDNVVANLTADTNEGGTSRCTEDGDGAWTITSLTGWNLTKNSVSDLMSAKAAATDNEFGAPGEPANGTYMLYLRDAWASVTDKVSQSVTLPAGDYKVTVDSKCVSGASGHSVQLTVGELASKALTISSTMPSEWNTTSVTFSLTAETTLDVAVSVTYGGSGASGLSVLLDNFKLYSVEEIEKTIEWTMTDAGWGTMILPFAATLADGLTAYSCDGTTTDEDTETTTVDLTEVGSSITANTPYIIKCTDDSAIKAHSFTGTPTNTVETYTAGILTGTLVDLAVAKGAAFATDGTMYLLQNHEDEDVAFYPIIAATEDADNSKDATLDAYHCYLTIASEDGEASPTKLSIILPGTGEETGIVAVESDVIANDAIYDLSGRRVSKAVKGVYIQNGKKVLVK